MLNQWTTDVPDSKSFFTVHRDCMYEYKALYHPILMGSQPSFSLQSQSSSERLAWGNTTCTRLTVHFYVFPHKVHDIYVSIIQCILGYMKSIFIQLAFQYGTGAVINNFRFQLCRAWSQIHSLRHSLSVWIDAFWCCVKEGVCSPIFGVHFQARSIRCNMKLMVSMYS